MKRRLSSSAASAGACAAMTIRVFNGLMLDTPEVCNGAWLSALFGMALALPLSELLRRTAGKRLVDAMLLLALAADAVVNIESTAWTAGFLAFDHTPTRLLAVPILCMLIRCVMLGGNAVGDTIRFLFRAVLPLLALVLLLHLPAYRPEWLNPVLGFGPDGIFLGGVRAGGWMAALAGATSRLVDSGEKRTNILTCVCTATALAAALIILRLMMAPQMDTAAMVRSIQIDAMLVNGRAPLYCQLPLVIVWFIGSFSLVGFECCLCAGLLGRVFPRLKGSVCAAMAVAAVALPLLALPNSIPWLRSRSEWIAVWVAMPAIMGFLWHCAGKGVRRTCAG